jgi:restriction system protein
MSIPDFQSITLPLLEFASDGLEHSLSQARVYISQKLKLTEDDLKELLPSGKQTRFDNRVTWSKVYLTQAGLLSSPKRAHFVITEAGKQLLKTKPERITVSVLDQYESFRQFRYGDKNHTTDTTSQNNFDSATVGTPEESLDAAYLSIRKDLSNELLLKVKAGSPKFFEILVVELLLKMGYGSNRAEAGRAIGQSGDEGIDGIISEDRLGLDLLYIQAKRWEGTVGRPEIQKFVGALHGKRARKGVFITTGTFTTEAREYVAHIDPRVVLIDGVTLSEYMIDYGLGVSTRTTYEVKRVDSDYFVEE